jgi:hypothetical protein
MSEISGKEDSVRVAYPIMTLDAAYIALYGQDIQIGLHCGIHQIAFQAFPVSTFVQPVLSQCRTPSTEMLEIVKL